jgi:hypothetical protein
LRPIDADTIEGCVQAEAARSDPVLTAGCWPDPLAEVLASLYSRINVDGTVDDVGFVRAHKPRPPSLPRRARRRAARLRTGKPGAGRPL